MGKGGNWLFKSFRNVRLKSRSISILKFYCKRVIYLQFDADQFLYSNWRRGIWRISAFVWHLMQIDFTCQLTQIEVLRGIWRRIISMAIDAEYFYFQKKKKIQFF